mmetsp:Transcript_10607/g.25991  ORF Transcript_10607/g.25991 Transcript_10607/m.25991 type:complete len:228 (+) Transcript_10607:321-1004(+)
MDSMGLKPPRAAPYPMLVGTAMTGTSTSPATTLGSAPSIPATTTTTSASRISSTRANSRWRPATPISTMRRVSATPMRRAVTAASSATDMSAVPAVSTATHPSTDATGWELAPTPDTRQMRATGLYSISGWSARMASYTSGVMRVAITTDCRSRSASMMRTICSGVFPGPHTTSGSPVRAPRPRSSLAKFPTSSVLDSDDDDVENPSEPPPLDDHDARASPRRRRCR